MKPNRRLLKKLREKVNEIRDEGNEVSVLFFDEARFGLQPCIGRVWCPKGVEPIANVKPGYSNFHIYSAVDQSTGEEFSLFLPEVNTEMMNLYLAGLQNANPGRSMILVMDQAGWHKSKELAIPDGIEIVFLPPYSPELNPIERLWKWIRRHFCRNRWFENLDELEKTLVQGWHLLNKELLTTLCRCNYIN